MYVRRTVRKRKDGAEVAYLALAHNERVNGTSSTRVLLNFGREDQLDPDALRRLGSALTRYLGDADPCSKPAASEWAWRDVAIPGLEFIGEDQWIWHRHHGAPRGRRTARRARNLLASPAMRSDILDNSEANSDPGSFTKQNHKMLKVRLSQSSGLFYAKQGSMVAYQGDVDFAYEGSGGMGKMFKKAMTSEGMALMKVSGDGDVFLADQADDVFLIHLQDESVTVGGDHVLAFESSLTWDINKVEGASMMSGGVFNTTFTGTGTLAITVHGTPVALNVDVPTFVDMQAAVLWSTSLKSGIRKTAKAKALIGRGSGEAYQLALSGQGIVVVQASEGHPVPKA